MILRLLGFYQRWISPALHSISGVPGACRFQPTCSEYATAAIELHGAWRGSLLALRRLGRCHPFASGGYDPVPPATGCFCRPSIGKERYRHLP